MKVVHFVRKPTRLGFSVERVFEDVRQELPDDIEVSVYTNHYASRGVWRRLAGMLDAALHQGDVNHITGDVHFLNTLMHRRRTVLTILDCVALERLKGVRYLILWVFWYWLPAKRATVITVISESAKRELQRHLGRGDWPIRVVPCPLSPEFSATPKAFHRDHPRILQVGTTSNKNIERVAAALEGMHCRLVIIGEILPDQLAALEHHQIQYENYLGLSRTQMLAQYRQCDIVMFASIYEGFGLPILEAQAVGRPVVTSRLYSMPEVGGDGAFYVDPYDILSIRKAVCDIIESSASREDIVRKGYRNVARYRVDVVASMYADIYRDVCQKSQGRP